MRVSELVELLQDMDPHAEVHFTYSIGDYWKTTAAPEVSRVAHDFVTNSGYHNLDVVIKDEDDVYDATGGLAEGVKKVVTIS